MSQRLYQVGFSSIVVAKLAHVCHQEKHQRSASPERGVTFIRRETAIVGDTRPRDPALAGILEAQDPHFRYSNAGLRLDGTESENVPIGFFYK